MSKTLNPRSINMTTQKLSAPPFPDMFAVKLDQIDVFSWIKNETTGNFTAIGQSGYEEWMVFGPAAVWIPQFVDGKESPSMEIAEDQIATVSDMAVRQMFGDALNLDLVQTDDGFASVLNGTAVLNWQLSDQGSDEYACIDAINGGMFGVWSASRHGFHEAEEVHDIDTFPLTAIPMWSKFAYRAAKLRGGN